MFFRHFRQWKSEKLFGGGVYIPHSIAVISPYKAGKNLSVLPGVVIGKNGEGDRSKTNPTILDNVTIGAESVVAKDVSSNKKI